MKNRDEFNDLYLRLTRLYTLTTGIVLTAFFAVAFLLNLNQINTLVSERFNSCIKIIESKLFTDSSISDLWLSDYEVKNNLAIFVFDNGKQIFYKGSDCLPDNREWLFENADALLSSGQSNIYTRPQSISTIRSGELRLNGNGLNKYCVYGSVSAFGSSFRSVIIVQYVPELTNDLFRNAALFILIDAFGIALLSVAGHYLIKKLLSPLRESKQKQADFISAASHELKSPLAVIRAQNTSNKIIEYECARMSQLIGDMLMLVSCDTGKWNVKLEPVDTEILISDLYDMFIPIARTKNIAVKLNLQDENLPHINGDYQRIVQVLSVITDNAINYSANGGTIEIAAKHKKGWVSISICDHGIGISDEDKAFVFDRFYRSDKSRSDKSHFGLGLSIAKELTEIMNGRITLSDTIGGGCTFTVEFKTI